MNLVAESEIRMKIQSITWPFIYVTSKIFIYLPFPSSLLSC